MYGQKIVHVGQRGLHSLGQRLVVGRAQQRVQPDQPVTTALQAGRLVGQQLGLATVPAIGNDHHDGLSAQRPTQPLVVERLDRIADAGTAGPVGHGTGDLSNGLVDAPVPQLASYTGQTSGEKESLNRLPGGHGVDKVEQHPCVAFH